MADLHLALDGNPHEVTLGERSVVVDGEVFGVRVEGEGRSLTVRVDGKPLRVEIVKTAGSHVTVRVSDREYDVEVEGRTIRPSRATSASPPPPYGEEAGLIAAPMTGRIVRVLVRAGDTV